VAQNGREDPGRVLVVDDEKAIQLLLQTVLRTAGHEVHVAGTAAAGIAQARELAGIDVALVDKNLPDGSGMDVIRALAREQPDAEVILITGYASLESAIEALRARVFDYVPKPFEDVNALRERVAAALAERRRHAPATVDPASLRDPIDAITARAKLLQAGGSPETVELAKQIAELALRMREALE
jgi:DNA-binding NtrC family response regulator